MSLLVDTSIWSLALRREQTAGVAEVDALGRALSGGETVVLTGIVLQGLLQGYRGPKTHSQIVAKFRALPVLTPTLEDHIAAAHDGRRQ